MSNIVPILRLVPEPETVEEWAIGFVPDWDVWYWDDAEIDLRSEACIVMSREDYLGHPEFRGIDYACAYLHWQMPDDVTRLIIADRDWISRLSSIDRERVLIRQIELERGLICPVSFFDPVPDDLGPYIVGEQVVLCNDAWSLVPDELQRQVVVQEQRRWDDLEYRRTPAHAPGHVWWVANTFLVRDGGNCLSIAAFGVTGNPRHRDFWMDQPIFRNLLARCGYMRVDAEVPEDEDVVTFEKDGEIIHAAWCVGPDRYLSKNGQSRFNPIRIVDWEMLAACWRDTVVVTYRQPGKERFWKARDRTVTVRV